MSLLNNLWWGMFLTANAIAMSTTETPLLDPALNAREMALSRASFMHQHYNNMLQNPASIANTKGIAIHSTEYIGIAYSNINIVHESFNTSIGLHYSGSSIESMTRSVAKETIGGLPVVDETEDLIPYEYHAMSVVAAKTISSLKIGAGFRHKTLVLDNQTNTSIHGLFGLNLALSDTLNWGLVARNIVYERDDPNDFQLTHPIYASGLQFRPTKKASLFLALIKNSNEITTHPTFHGSVEVYVNDFVPIRGGLDHNRYTFGTGLYLDPFEIDIAWAQSRSPVIDDQVTLSFSYGLEEKNYLYSDD